MSVMHVYPVLAAGSQIFSQYVCLGCTPNYVNITELKTTVRQVGGVVSYESRFNRSVSSENERTKS